MFDSIREYEKKTHERLEGRVDMKKKTIIIVSCIISIVLVVVIAMVLIPKIILHITLTPLLKECKAAEYVTDFNTVEENGIKVSNDYFSVVIPQGYTEREGLKEELNVTVYENGEDDRRYMIFDEPSDMKMSLLAPEYYNGEDNLNGVKLEKLGEIFRKQGYPTPDSYFNITKATLLLDKSDYNFWSMDSQVVFSVLGPLRMSLYQDTQEWIYECDNIRAIIVRHGDSRFIIDVVKTEDMDNVYGISIRTTEEEDAWKLLNSLEFH